MSIIKRKFISFIVTFCMLVGLVPVTSAADLPFTDVGNDWSYQAIEYVYDNSLMIGTSTTTFSPDDTTNRAMIVTILYRMEGSPAVIGNASFSDVPNGQWYSDAVTWAEDNGIATGYPDGTFGPNVAITREQTAAFFYRYAYYKGYDEVVSDDLSKYTDKGSISSYALADMKWAVGYGLITGVSETELAPQSNTTRAQTAAILMRFCRKIISQLSGRSEVAYEIVREDNSYVKTTNGGYTAEYQSSFDKLVITDESYAYADQINKVFESDWLEIVKADDLSAVTQAESRKRDVTFYNKENMESVYDQNDLLSYCGVSYGWKMDGVCRVTYYTHTFDLDTGEELTLMEVLGMSREETEQLIINAINGQYPGFSYIGRLGYLSSLEFQYYIDADGTVVVCFSSFVGTGISTGLKVRLPYSITNR